MAYIVKGTNLKSEQAYRIRLIEILDVIRYLLGQGLAFRGHDESSTSLRKGNFLELVHWYSLRNEEVGNVVLKNAPGNNQMTAPLIQKDMINACVVETTLVMLGDLGDKSFSIMVDKARDFSVKEQMAVVIRYVNKRGEIIERFLGLVHVRETSTKCLKEAIESLFAKYGLSLSRLRGQGYDGAANMRGEFCHTSNPSPTRLADPNRFPGSETQDWDFFFFLKKANWHLWVWPTTYNKVKISYTFTESHLHTQN